MKHILLIVAALCTKQSVSQTIKIVKETKDTIYIETTRLPHHCNTVEDCIYQDKFYFFPNGADEKWRYFQRVHFYHPYKGYSQIIREYNALLLTTNL